MEKITRKELKKPDLFLYESGKVAEWGAKHKKLFFATVGALLTVGVIWTIYGTYSEGVEQKAQAELFDAQKLLKPMEDPKVPAPGKAKTQATEDQYKPALEKLKNVVDKYPRTQAAAFAALEFSRVNYGFKKYGDSIGLLEKIKNTARHAVPKALVYNALAMNYVGQADCNNAIGAWNQIEGRDEMAFMHADTYVNKGLCFEKLGQKDKAVEMYRKAEAQTKNPDAAQKAKKYLRLLQ